MSARALQQRFAQWRRRVRTLNQALHLRPLAKEGNLALHSLRIDHKHHVLRGATSAVRRNMRA
jgi:hypothetical protein